MSSSSPLILLTGATATGKTQISLEIAKELSKSNIKSEIINGDSLLFYRELNIGTAKPEKGELALVPHHLIDTRSVTEPMNASDYAKEAEVLIDHLHSQKIVPIITGGSAFYVRALIKGLYEGESSSEESIKKVQQLEAQGGWSSVRSSLKEYDPESFESLHENDHYRNKRALEYFFTTGKKFSSEKIAKEEEGPYDFSKPQKSHWRIHHAYLQIPKEDHWEIMDKRVEQMLKRGLVEETQHLLEKGYDPHLKPLQSIGYKETIDYLKFLETQIVEKDKPTDIISLRERIFINTRRLAKSQKTFFKKINPKITYNSLREQNQIIKETLDFL
ncbi:MAG: tRNA (adenosine(37)-N6)-dimethylallyltransferase MiaA, partial [Halobacteriovoraceae bacterium]|nr:tRNA (adenosine(37)-N6)-dimethylallyltransferase MiaA [Halobacteriovoraceae bacterium]